MPRFYTITELYDSFNEESKISRLRVQRYEGVWVCAECGQWYDNEQTAKLCEEADRAVEALQTALMDGQGKVLPEKETEK